MNRDYPARPAWGAIKPERHRSGGASFRLFLAVELPAEATGRLIDWQKEFLAGDGALRLCPPTQLHITLVFLGQTGEAERDQAAAALQELVGARAFEATAVDIVGLPVTGQPRVIAATIEEPSGRLRGIHDSLVAGLVQKNLYRREKRPYLPHVTIARVRERTRLDVGAIHPEPVKFTAVRVTLYNSILRQAGALHEPLKTVQLI